MNIYIYIYICQSLFTLFSFPFLSLTYFLSVFPFFPFFHFFLSLPYFLLLLLFTQEHPNIYKTKPCFFRMFVCPSFLSLSFSDFLSFCPFFKTFLAFLPSFLIPFSLLFLLCSSFFPSFLVSLPSFPSKPKKQKKE